MLKTLWNFTKGMIALALVFVALSPIIKAAGITEQHVTALAKITLAFGVYIVIFVLIVGPLMREGAKKVSDK